MTLPLPPLDGVEHRFIDVTSGLRMHVAEAGAGDPIVLLHGWPEHWWAWRRLIPRLAERNRLVCPDLRGFGWSDAPALGYGTEQLSDDVVRLLDALELQRIRFIGHDWGGFIGFLICLGHPARVERFLGLNTAHPFPLVDGRTLATLWRFWYQLVIATPGLGPRAVGLLLQGKRDPVLRPAFLHGYEPYADDMTLEFVDDCGHLLPEERPDVVLSRAIDFFAG